jgi:diguanylate cyclase (GGDEF)-like protein/PAS domain S-box-containing protein
MEQPMSPPDPLPSSPRQDETLAGAGKEATIEPEAGSLDCAAVIDLQGVIRYCTSGCALLVGRSDAELVGRSAASVFPGLALPAEARDENLSPIGSPSQAPLWRPLTLLGANGTTLALEASVRPLGIDGGRAVVLELRRRGGRPDRLAMLQRLAWAAEQAADAVAITDANGVIEFVNAAFEEMTGYPRSELVGRTHAVVKSGEHGAAFYRELWATISRGEVYRAVLINRRRGGSLFHEEETIRAIKDETGRIVHFVATGRDVSDRVRTIDRLRHAATHDPLTDLPNRSLFMDRLGQVLKRAARRNETFALAIADIDRFKAINDRLGHAVGDAVLRTVASRLGQCVRETDTVARIGGDEFALILVDAGEAGGVIRVLEKVVAALAAPVHAEGQPVQVAVSVGACLCHDLETDEHRLTSGADAAMYAAKRAGGNRFRLVRANGRLLSEGAAPLSEGAPSARRVTPSQPRLPGDRR